MINYHLNSMKIMILSVGLLLTTGVNCSSELVCKDLNRISQPAYWELFADSHIIEYRDTDGKTMRWVRFATVDPEKENCYLVDTKPSVGFEKLSKHLNDPENKTIGFKDKISFWLHFKPLESQAVNLSHKIGDGSLTVEKRIEELTGESFTSTEEWRAWWIENWEYLVWSDKKDRLILDSKAKSEKKPLIPFREISAEDYWFFISSGLFENLRNIGSFSFFQTKNFQHHGFFNAKVNLKGIDDLPVKEKGYKRAVVILIRNLREMEDSLEQFRSVAITESTKRMGLAQFEEAIEELTQKLKLLTKQSLGNSEQWKHWYEKNNDRLFLSKDQEYLTLEKN